MALEALDTGRLSLAGQPIHAGDVLEVLVAGRAVAARVEWSERSGWYAVLPQAPGGPALHVLLRPGVRARWSER